VTPAVETWSNGKPELLCQTVSRLEAALLPVRVVDAAYCRSFYSTPEGPVDALATITGSVVAGSDALKQRQRFNLLRSAIGSYCAMVVDVPSMDVSTSGGSSAQQRSAESLGQWIDGVYLANEMRATAWQCVTDSALTRVAAVKVEFDGEAGFEVGRLQPNQIVWNPNAGPKPREIFTRTAVSRAELLAKHGDDPAKRQAIEDALSYRPDPLWDGIDGAVTDDLSDMVELFEGWRTAEKGAKSAKDGKGKGRYVAAVRTRSGSGGVLEDEEWKHTFHCVVPLRFDWSYGSYAGVPAADTLWHYQVELDDYSATIKEACVKGAVNRWFVEKGSEVDTNLLDATQGRIVEHNPGMRPVPDRGTTLPPEYLQREETIIRRAFDFLGLSYNQARGMKSPGVQSGKGIREDAAIGQNRLVLYMQAVQDWLVAIAKVLVALADALYQEKKDIEVRAPGASQLRRVKWSEIGYKEQDFLIHCDAINKLSRHPAARVDEVLELVQAKIIDERQGLRAIGVKDLQRVRDTAFAMEDFIEKLIDQALAGQPRQPDPYLGADGLERLIKRGQERYLAELVQEDEGEYLYLLRRLIEGARGLLERMKGGAPAAAAPAGELPAEVPPEMAVAGAGLPEGVPAPPPPVPGQGLTL
jgi:hypothetical protein